MLKAAKESAVAELAEALAGSQAVILTDYRGLTVGKLTELRRNLAKAGARYRVVKNSLLRRALTARADPQGPPWESLDPHLVGPLGAVLVPQDAVAAAKELTDFARRNGLPAIKMALVEGQLLGPEQVQVVAALPPRPELLARLVGQLQGPIAGLVSTLQSLTGRLTLTLMAVIDKREAGTQGADAA